MMDPRPSSVTTTAEDGWTWLAPSRRGAELRQGFWSIVLALLLIVLAAAATLPPPPLAVPLVALVLAGGIWLSVTLWNRAHSGVAVSNLGIAVRGGFDVTQVAWPAVDGVVGRPHGPRLRIVVEVRGGTPLETSAAFTREAALSWLDACAEHAERRHMRPAPVDGMAGFRTT